MACIVPAFLGLLSETRVPMGGFGWIYLCNVRPSMNRFQVKTFVNIFLQLLLVNMPSLTGLVSLVSQEYIFVYTLCIKKYRHPSVCHNMKDCHVIKWRWHFLCNFMMTSSNGNIFRVTGPFCGEFTGPGEFPTQRPVTRSFDVFLDLRLNKRLNKQSWGWWFETLSRPFWRHRNVMEECQKMAPGK